jgi:hypothetical protein
MAEARNVLMECFMSVFSPINEQRVAAEQKIQQLESQQGNKQFLSE